MSDVNVLKNNKVGKSGNKEGKSWMRTKLIKIERWISELSLIQRTNREATMQLGEDQQKTKSDMLKIIQTLNEKIEETRLEFGRELRSLKNNASRDDSVRVRVDDLHSDMEKEIKLMKDLSDKVQILEGSMDSLNGEVDSMKQNIDMIVGDLKALKCSMDNFKKENEKMDKVRAKEHENLRKDVEIMKENRCRSEVLECFAAVLHGKFFAEGNYNQILTAKFTANQKELHMELKIEISKHPDKFEFVKSTVEEHGESPSVDDVKQLLMEQAITHPVLGAMIGNYTNRFITNINNNSNVLM
ncbi:uncharacterized protein LOC120329313 [Styela clava]